MISILILLIILTLSIVLWQISNLISIIFGSPYVSSNAQNVIKILNGFKTKNKIFYDLGCGNGDTVIYASQKMQMNATGFEISPFYYLLARIKSVGKKNCQIKYQNIFKVDLSKADFVYCYLLPKFLQTLVPKFKKELKKSAYLISIGFPISDLKQIKAGKINGRKYFIYQN